MVDGGCAASMTMPYFPGLGRVVEQSPPCRRAIRKKTGMPSASVFATETGEGGNRQRRRGWGVSRILDRS
jgi:hypothetical protein